MDISPNAKVNCSNGLCGQATQVILKPSTREITHLVVSNGAFPETQYLVSIDQVTDSKPDQIQLKCSSEELSKMPIYNQAEFIPSGLAGFPGGPYMMWPYYPAAVTYSNLDDERIPAGELSIRRGSRVEAVDGHVGSVDEFLIDPSNDQITHLVMREGHLWGQKDVTIPVSQIDRFQDHTVFLKLKKQDIEQLPGIPIQHSWI